MTSFRPALSFKKLSCIPTRNKVYKTLARIAGEDMWSHDQAVQAEFEGITVRESRACMMHMVRLIPKEVETTVVHRMPGEVPTVVHA